MKHNNSRRNFIKLAGGASASLVCWNSFANNLVKNGAQANQKKLVWVVLRGALDSLHTVVPTFETVLKDYRPNLYNKFNSPLLPLDGKFALHPALKNLHQWYQEKQFAPVVAVSSGYQERSHFDGQDFLESGKGEIDHDTGWLARAIDVQQKQALAVSYSVPISLRSSRAVQTWYPNNLKDSKEDIYAQLARLYKYNDDFSMALEKGLDVKEMAGTEKKNRNQGKFKELAKACGNLLKGNENDCAMLEVGGWDTHNNQATRLTRQLTELDQGLAALKESLAEQWQNTVVIVATEFGRTVKENGTLGTDHGTGSALFIAGGSVKGGQVLGNWPGLAEKQLYQGRDLMPTTNSFTWMASVLKHHWQFNDKDIAKVFPQINSDNKLADQLFV